MSKPEPAAAAEAPATGAEILTPFGDYRTPVASAEVIEVLEEMLSRAMAGEIKAIAIAALQANDRSLTVWRSGSESSFTLIGLVEVLKDDILDLGRKG